MTDFAVWLTGLSGAGKTTLAGEVAGQLRARGRSVEVLDGDELRQRLSPGLGFSRADRDCQVRRVGTLAKRLMRQQVVPVVALISPFRATRDEVRERLGAGFIEVHVDCPLQVLIQRDPKGLYRRALSGELTLFTGISDPYEPPLRPEVVVHTDRETVEACTRRIVLRALTTT